MSCSNRGIGRNTLVPAFTLLITLVVSVQFTTSFVAASSTNLITGSNGATSSKITAILLNPYPRQIDKDSSLIQNFNLPSNLTRSIGTIADGVSKLIIEVKVFHKDPLTFSIVGTNPKNLSDGTLSPLITSPGIEKPLSSIVVSPYPTKNGTLVVVAVYTPPDFINEPTATYKNIKVSINDPENSSVSFSTAVIRLYHPPVVLVHGLWENPTYWTAGNFSQNLAIAHFDVTPADYGKYNASTFDPYLNKTFGNYGINAIRYAIHIALDKLHNKSIAASQADVVAHSMGGLMARGFVQQPDYKNITNYMKGYIHRLITIGTPHFGAPLSKFLIENRSNTYCQNFNYTNKNNLPPEFLLYPSSDTKVCKAPQKLTDIYNHIVISKFNLNLSLPIDQGGVESLIPNSTAYRHLCQTNVRSYSIVGNWMPIC
jgi:pimeloyl-ACP methyl ester carboxylesterase